MIGVILGIIITILVFRFIITPFWGLSWKNKLIIIGMVVIFFIVALLFKGAASTSIG